MSARSMYDSMNAPAPAGKLKHSGNKRKQLARLKVQARRAERHSKKMNKEFLNER